MLTGGRPPVYVPGVAPPGPPPRVVYPTLAFWLGVNAFLAAVLAGGVAGWRSGLLGWHPTLRAGVAAFGSLEAGSFAALVGAVLAGRLVRPGPRLFMAREVLIAFGATLLMLGFDTVLGVPWVVHSPSAWAPTTWKGLFDRILYGLIFIQTAWFTTLPFRFTFPKRCPVCGARGLMRVRRAPRRLSSRLFEFFWCAGCEARVKRPAKRRKGWADARKGWVDASHPLDDLFYHGKPPSWRESDEQPPAPSAAPGR